MNICDHFFMLKVILNGYLDVKYLTIKLNMEDRKPSKKKKEKQINKNNKQAYIFIYREGVYSTYIVVILLLSCNPIFKI